MKNEINFIVVCNKFYGKVEKKKYAYGRKKERKRSMK